MSKLLNCPMCSYIASHEEQLLRHVCQIHKHDPNFLIYCSKCSRSFTKLELFRKHKLRSSQCSNVTFAKTPTSPGPSDDMSATNYDSEESLASSVVPRGLSMKWRAATYIMEIKEKHLLSQAAVDTVISSTTSLVNGLLQGALAELREELPEDAKKVLDQKAQEGSFDLQPFSGLETAYLQNKYFRECFKLVVSSI